MKVDLLYKTPNLINPTYTFEVSDITTKTLMALSRHQTIQLTVQSSRYTMKKSIKNSNKNEDLITLSKDVNVYEFQVKQINDICEFVKNNPDVSQDDLNLLLPQGYRYSLVMSLDDNALNHFYEMRNSETHAHWDIQDLAEQVWYAKDYKSYEELNTPLSVVARAIRKCYSTESKSDNGGEKDLALIKRVGVQSKHYSVLRHCIIAVNENFGVPLATKYAYRTRDVENDVNVIVYNLQELVELSENYSDAIKIMIPKKYHYLLH